MAEAAPIDVERLRVTFEDDTVLAELYAMYVQDTGERLVELRAAVDMGNLEQVCRTGHTLKGSSANVGASTMSVVAAELEATDIGDGGEAVTTLVVALEREFARVERFVNDFIAQTEALR